MRKKISLIGIIIVLISGLLTGCSSGFSANSELKDEYKNDVSATFAENYKQLTLCAVKLNNNYDEIKSGNLDEYVELSGTIRENGNLSDSESLILKKHGNIYSDFLSIYVDKKDVKTKLKDDIQSVLDCYK